MTPRSFDIQDGRCVVVVAYDVGTSIRIEKGEQRITATKERGRIKRNDLLLSTLMITPRLFVSLKNGNRSTSELTTSFPPSKPCYYDLGAIMVTYQIPLAGPFAALLPLSEQLYENPQLLEGSLRHVQSLLETLSLAVEKPNLSAFVEDYAIFHIFSTEPVLHLSL